MRHYLKGVLSIGRFARLKDGDSIAFLGCLAVAYQPAITSETIETLEQGVIFKFNNTDTKTKPMVSFWCLYC